MTRWRERLAAAWREVIPTGWREAAATTRQEVAATDWRESAVTAGWLVVGGISLLVVLATALAAVGFLAGGYDAPAGSGAGTESAPTVDPADPPGEVAADALAALDRRDHTREWWLAGRNRTGSERVRGIVSRTEVQHSAGRVRQASWATRMLGLENGTVTPDSPPGHVLFANRLHYRWQRGHEGDTWQRVHRRGIVYDRDGLAFVTAPDRLRDANVGVVAENDSALVVRTDDPDALAAFETIYRFRGNATATVVVTKGADPHVRQVTLRNRTGPVVRSERFVVSEVGTTEVARPDPAPPFSATETAVRVVTGLERLVG